MIWQNTTIIKGNIIFTGYENEYGKYASSFYKAKDDLVVLAKIEKFPNNPNYHYFLITQNTRTGELDIIERRGYEYITESYGFLYNNNRLDQLEPVASMNDINSSILFVFDSDSIGDGCSTCSSELSISGSTLIVGLFDSVILVSFSKFTSSSYNLSYS